MANREMTPFRRGSLATGGMGDAGGGTIFDLNRQINRLFDNLFERPGGNGQGLSGMGAAGMGSGAMAVPALEVHQTQDRVEVTAELPGVKEEDIELTVEDGVLTLRGEKRSERTDQERGYSERSYGRFERAISLPPNVDEEKCSADFRDGVLRITMPKSEERARGRRIPLGAGGAERSGAERGGMDRGGAQASNDQSGKDQSGMSQGAGKA